MTYLFAHTGIKTNTTKNQGKAYVPIDRCHRGLYAAAGVQGD